MQNEEKLILFFECGGNKFAVLCSDVAEVIPRIDKNGTIEYHGQEVLVTDFSEMQTGSNSTSVLSTRIILLNTRDKGKNSIIGLVAEKVQQTEKYSAEAIIKSSSLNGLSNQQIVTTEANIPVIDPECMLVAMTRESSAEKK